MKYLTVILLLPFFVLSGCATTEQLVSSPSVRLTWVELSKANFGSQTFVLGFDVYNPNAFPLPVKSVKYRIQFDDESFARDLFAQQNVTVLPGSYLSRLSEDINPGSNHVRMALVAPLDECIDAANRMSAFIQSL